VNEPGGILPPVERRLRNREEVVATILDAAGAVMGERGMAGLSLHEVARRVGMRATSLYGYSSSKAALYDTLFHQGLKRVRATVQRLAYDRPFWEEPEGAFAAYRVFAAESPELYRLVFERPVPGFVPSEESMAASQGQPDAPGGTGRYARLAHAAIALLRASWAPR
jgi:AcrR family transcriptional regulator